MSPLTDFIKFDLYPVIFEVIPSVFPEHDFKQYRGNWQSKTYLNGSPHLNRRDKTIISKKAPGLILEQGGEVLSLLDYVVKRDNIEFIDAVKLLAKNVGLELPKGEFNLENYKSYKERNTLFEECNIFFNYCLKTSMNNDKVKNYLLKSRGYSLEEVEAMEIGFIPGQDKLFSYLKNKGFSEELIKKNIKLDKRIGVFYSITIPYRTGGSIKGFKFRTIEELIPKYLNSTGMDKIGGFFNLSSIKGDKDLIIVEGELDSLSATVKGIDNVVATGGSSINSNQVRDAIKRGAKNFTICFDYEPGREEATNKNINTAVEVLLKEGVNSVYIVTFPNLKDIKIDPDSFIRNQGIEAFKTVIQEAIPFYEWRLNRTLDKFSKIENTKGALTYKDKDNLLEEVIVTASNLTPISKDQYLKSFMSLDPIQELGITEESLDIAVDKLTSTQEREAQKKEFKSLLSQAINLQDKGEVPKALDLLSKEVKEIKLTDKVTEFSSLLVNTTEEGLKNRQKNKPENLRSGLVFGGEPMGIPAGAVTIITAPTSHGKTTFLINLALNITQEHKEKQIYLFSYEEDRDSILINTLNTYLNEEISGNNRATLKNYFSGKNKRTLSNQKDIFFKELINTQRLNVNYTNYNSETLIEAIRFLHKNANPGAIFIDYIQLLNLPQGKYKTYSRQEELKQICQDLKDLAVETGLPIILGAQFNRSVKNPLQLHATNIGEAGDIERVANLIIGFWNNNFTPVGTEGELNSIKKLNYPKDSIYIKVLKNRVGRVGQEEVLDFNGNTGKISNQNINLNDVEF
jgi:DNA primase catalytic core